MWRERIPAELCLSNFACAAMRVIEMQTTAIRTTENSISTTLPRLESMRSPSHCFLEDNTCGNTYLGVAVQAEELICF